jgi:hypothetical protein
MLTQIVGLKRGSISRLSQSCPALRKAEEIDPVPENRSRALRVLGGAVITFFNG